MQRYISNNIKKYLDKKIILLTGPRQVGKTWLAKNLCPTEVTVYLNYDRAADRSLIKSETWDREAKLIVFDELHKMKGWKNWIKGIYDTEGTKPSLLVTGSARFDAFRRGGRESLAGRHFLYRLHPLSMAELAPQEKLESVFQRLLTRGGFPEPFLAADQQDADRWRLSHLNSILREDLRDLTSIQDLRSVEYLVERLALQVGSPVSYQSLAEDVGVSAPTIKRWIQALEAMYIIFIIYPWSRKVKGSILKQPKIYFYDTGRIPLEQEASRFENLVACALLKHIQFNEDTKGIKGSLFYLRDKQKREVDFLAVQNSHPTMMVECKLSANEEPQFASFQQVAKNLRPVLLVCKAARNESHKEWDLKQAAPWLTALDA